MTQKCLVAPILYTAHGHYQNRKQWLCSENTLFHLAHFVSFDNHRTLVSQMEIAGGAGPPVVGSHDIGKSKINVFCKGKVSLSNKVKTKVKIHFSPGDICIWNFNIFQKNSNFMVLKGNKLFFLKTGIIHDFFNNRPDFV